MIAISSVTSRKRTATTSRSLPKCLWHLIRTHITYIAYQKQPNISLSTLKTHQENRTFVEWEFTSYDNQRLHAANLRRLQRNLTTMAHKNETNEKEKPNEIKLLHCQPQLTFTKLLILRDNTNRNITAEIYNNIITKIQISVKYANPNTTSVTNNESTINISNREH